jgi:3-oxoacyl-[acyl-carrier-protein] synthase III
MRLCNVPAGCIGLDITAGCLATLAALEVARGWLGQRGGGCAAVVAGERWSQTIDYSDPSTVNLWAYGDSAGAIVVGYGTAEPALAMYLGAEFRSASGNNGHVLVPYGGTRAPVAPPGVDPFMRTVSSRPKEEVTSSYRDGYRSAHAALRQRCPQEPDRLICNQMSPQLVGMLSALLEMEDRVTRTGDRTGHLGGTDVIVGLDEWLADDADPVALVCASAAYGFGTALVTASPR